MPEQTHRTEGYPENHCSLSAPSGRCTNIRKTIYLSMFGYRLYKRGTLAFWLGRSPNTFSTFDVPQSEVQRQILASGPRTATPRTKYDIPTARRKVWPWRGVTASHTELAAQISNEVTITDNWRGHFLRKLN
jgi:hypothetical protein